MPYENASWIEMPMNIGRRNSIYASLSVDFRPTNNLSFRVYCRGSYSKSEVADNEVRVAAQEGFGSGGQLFFDWTIPRWFNVSGAYWHSGKSVGFVSRGDYSDFWWMRITKKLNPKAKLSLMFRNFFIPQENSTHKETAFYDEFSTSESNSRSIRLTFTYNFSVGKKSKAVNLKNVETDM